MELAAALGLSRVMEGMLYEVNALDLPTFVGVTLLLAITAVIEPLERSDDSG